jgi:hypothetical protein
MLTFMLSSCTDCWSIGWHNNGRHPSPETQASRSPDEPHPRKCFDFSNVGYTSLLRESNQEECSVGSPNGVAESTNSFELLREPETRPHQMALSYSHQPQGSATKPCLPPHCWSLIRKL